MTQRRNLVDPQAAASEAGHHELVAAIKSGCTAREAAERSLRAALESFAAGTSNPIMHPGARAALVEAQLRQPSFAAALAELETKAAQMITTWRFINTDHFVVVSVAAAGPPSPMQRGAQAMLDKALPGFPEILMAAVATFTNPAPGSAHPKEVA